MKILKGCQSLCFEVLPLLAVLTLGMSARAQGKDATTIALRRAEQYLDSQAASGSLRGSVLIGINGRIVFEKGFGFADQEWGALNTAQTKFRIASLTKQFIGACVLLLKERGKLNINDPVSKYVPDLPPAWRPITLHELLTHTSGIPNYPGLPRVEQVLNRTGAIPQELIELVAALEFTPGTKLQYTNTVYILLGLVIEKISGQAYGSFLQTNIFAPLDMCNSRYDDVSKIFSQRSSGYMIKDGHITNADFIDISIPFAAGGIYSTVEDMYRWNEALANGKLLTPSSTGQVFAIYPETILQGQHYGFLVVIAERFGRCCCTYHGGRVKGFETAIQRYPKERICIIVLENLDPTAPWVSEII